MSPNQEIRTIAIIPAYNEERTIGAVVDAALQAETTDAVVVVDDGSTDDTQNVARNAANLHNNAVKTFDVVTHVSNEGKTEALISGVERARELGSLSLSTLILLDADSSPIWSRDTADNMKLWQIAVNRMARLPSDTVDEQTLLGRESVFISLLSRYIDEITQPVASGDVRMRMGMYERNVVTDTLLTITNWGGHAGNRALGLDDWDKVLRHAEERGITLTDWEIEAALNMLIPDEETSSFVMRGVVNVGSRRKSGSTIKGLARMARIHGQAIKAAVKLR